jgi:hypothetical protein
MEGVPNSKVCTELIKIKMEVAIDNAKEILEMLQGKTEGLQFETLQIAWKMAERQNEILEKVRKM